MKYLMLLLLGVTICCPSGHAATAIINAKVTQVLTSSNGSYGECMARLNVVIADIAAVDCPTPWVSFSCDGTYATEAAAFNMFDSVKMAFALDKVVLVFVDDSKKFGNHCYAFRLQVKN